MTWGSGEYCVGDFSFFCKIALNDMKVILSFAIGIFQGIKVNYFSFLGLYCGQCPVLVVAPSMFLYLEQPDVKQRGIIHQEKTTVYIFLGCSTMM